MSGLAPDDELRRLDVAVMLVLRSELGLPPARGSRFRDVAVVDDCWTEAVNVLDHHGIVRGVSAELPLFDPGGSVSRIQVEFFLRPFELGNNTEEELENYVDADPDGTVTREHLEALLDLATPLESLRDCWEGHLSGLAPDDELRRLDVAVMLVLRSELGLPPARGSRFRDVAVVDDCWTEAVNVLDHHGIVRGVSAELPLFDPGGSVSRIQVEFFLRPFELGNNTEEELENYVDADPDGTVTREHLEALLDLATPLESLRDCWEGHLSGLAPDDELRRLDVAVMLVLRSELGLPPARGSRFRDVAVVDDCWTEAVNVLDHHGIVRGVSAELPLFDPGGSVSRIQVEFFLRPFELGNNTEEELENYVDADPDGTVTREHLEALLSRDMKKR